MRATSERTVLGDAWDAPDTGKPPCDFCRREVPCECAGEPCMCTCGRCWIDPTDPEYKAAILRALRDRP